MVRDTRREAARRHRPEGGGYNASVQEEAARRVLLVQAIEEVDRQGRLLPLEERERATSAARQSEGDDPVPFLAHRASRLIERLAPRHPWVETVLGATRFPAGAVWALLLAAGAAGLLTDALGPERRINILSVPILGLILWNLAVYAGRLALAALDATRRGRPARPRPEPTAGTTHGWTRLLMAWAERRARRQVRPAATEEDDPAWPAVGLFLRRWRPLAVPVLAARVQVLLHVGAALLALGVLGGAYGRGLAFEYRATWESTFMDAGDLRVVLVVLLGPASHLLGEPIPDAAGLAALRAPGSGDAAPWIHRYALTTLLAVVVPRLALAAIALRRARRLSAHRPVDLRSAYFVRLTAAGRALARVLVVPYGVRLSSTGEQAVAALLRSLAGGAAEIGIAPSVPYGGDGAAVPETEPAAAGAGAPETWRAVVFNLAQSPEDEVHGAVLQELAAWVARGGGDRRRAVALVDGASYRARLTGTGAETQRVADRRRAWDRVAARAGTPLVHLDLDDGPADDQAIASLHRGLWPALEPA